MKRIVLLVVMASVWMVYVADASEGEVPAVEIEVVKRTAEEKAALKVAAVTDSAAFGSLLIDMEMDEAVVAFDEILNALEAENPRAEVKVARTAIMTAYMFRKWSSQARVLADKIVQAVDLELLPPIVAAAAVTMGNQASIVTGAFIDRAPEGYAQNLRNAGSRPETVLPQGLLLSIGLPVTYSGPVGGRAPTALPVAPPLNVAGEGSPVPVSVPPPASPPSGGTEPEPVPPPPPPPPVPDPYSGI